MLFGRLFGRKKNEDLFTSVLTRNPPPFCNIVIIEDLSSYKAALLKAFCDEKDPSNYANSNISISFRKKEFKIADARTTLNIWSINGKENPGTILSQYCRGVHGVVLCFDLSNTYSIKYMKSVVGDNYDLLSNLKIPIYIIDVYEEKTNRDPKLVALEKEVKAFASKAGAKVANCSLDNIESVNKVFEDIIIDVAARFGSEPNRDRTRSTFSKKPSTQPPKPSTQPPKPLTQPPKPLTQPPKPSTQPPRPLSQPPKPSTQPPKPLTQPPKPLLSQTEQKQQTKDNSEEEVKDINPAKDLPMSLISLCKYEEMTEYAKRDVKRNENGLFGEYRFYDFGLGYLYYRVSVLGNPRIGKSCLCARYLKDERSRKSESNRLWVRSFNLPNGMFLKLQMHEGPLPHGGTVEEAKEKEHFSQSHAILLCYDVTDRASFDSVARAAAEVRAGAMRGAVLMVVGLRCDAKEWVEVPGREGQAFACANGMAFRECSAADDVGVCEVFTKILLEMQQADSFALPINIEDARRVLPLSVLPKIRDKSAERLRSTSLLSEIITEQSKMRAKKIESGVYPKHDYLFRVIIVGNFYVGKTKLLLRYSEDTFDYSHLHTVGVGFKIKSIEYVGKIVELQIWDTGYQEEFHQHISRGYYKGTQAIILCFDTTNIESFENLNIWMHQIEEYASEKVSVVIVGTKSDLPPAVDPVTAYKYADSLGRPLMYCSSMTGDGVDEVFEKAVTLILKEITE